MAVQPAVPLAAHHRTALLLGCKLAHPPACGLFNYSFLSSRSLYNLFTISSRSLNERVCQNDNRANSAKLTLRACFVKLTLRACSVKLLLPVCCCCRLFSPAARASSCCQLLPPQRPGHRQLRHGAPASSVFPMVLRHSASASSIFPMALRCSALASSSYATALPAATSLSRRSGQLQTSSGGEKYYGSASNLAHLGRIC